MGTKITDSSTYAATLFLKKYTLKMHEITHATGDAILHG